MSGNKIHDDVIKSFIFFFKSEVLIVLIINIIIMVLTYIFKGVKGVEEVIKSVNNQFDNENIIAIIITCGLGFVGWIFYKFFNFKLKNTLRLVSEGLLDTIIALLRLAGGMLLAFTLLYLLVDGLSKSLLLFVFYGLLAVLESTFFVVIKYKMFARWERPLKNSTW